MNIFLSELSSDIKEKDIVRRLKLIKIVFPDENDETEIISKALDLYLLARKNEKEKYTTLKERYWQAKRMQEFEKSEIDNIIERYAK